VGINTAKQMSRDGALKKVAMLQKEWARQHRLVEEYDRRSGPAIREILENKFKGMVARD
jgi:hypothetical protein